MDMAILTKDNIRVDSVDKSFLALNSGRYDGFLFYVII